MDTGGRNGNEVSAYFLRELHLLAKTHHVKQFNETLSLLLSLLENCKILKYLLLKKEPYSNYSLIDIFSI